MDIPQPNGGANAATGDHPGLQRVLGPLDATCVVIGAIIGVGIFFSPGSVARVAGSAPLALTAWILAGGIALAGAFTFAALGRVYHSAGGQYEILRSAYGRLPSFLYVFCNATGIQAGAIAIIACISVQNLGLAVVGSAPDGWRLLTLASILIALIVAANMLGVRWGAGIQNLTVFAKVAALIVIAILAVVAAPAQTAAPASASASTGGQSAWILLFSAITPCFFSYGGWQHALWISGEIRDPRRNIPIAILVGVAIVIAVYVTAAWSFFALLGYEGVTQSTTLAADAVAVVWGKAGRRIIAGAVAVSAFGVLNAQLLSGPRLIYRMACEGQFFSAFGRLTRSGSPAAAILLLGGFGLVVLWGVGALGGDTAGALERLSRGDFMEALVCLTSGDAVKALDRLTTGVVVVDGVFFALTAAAIYVLAGRPEGRVLRSGRFGFPVAPAVFVLGELGLLVASNTNPETRSAAKIGLAFIAVAALIWVGFFRHERRRPA